MYRTVNVWCDVMSITRERGNLQNIIRSARLIVRTLQSFFRVKNRWKLKVYGGIKYIHCYVAYDADARPLSRYGIHSRNPSTGNLEFWSSYVRWYIEGEFWGFQVPVRTKYLYHVYYDYFSQSILSAVASLLIPSEIPKIRYSLDLHWQDQATEKLRSQSLLSISLCICLERGFWYCLVNSLH